MASLNSPLLKTEGIIESTIPSIPRPLPLAIQA